MCGVHGMAAYMQRRQQGQRRRRWLGEVVVGCIRGEARVLPGSNSNCIVVKCE